MRILWVSRHKMTAEQLDSLKKNYGDIEIINADRTFTNAQEIIDFTENIDVYAVVLPTEILVDLYKLLPADKDLIIPYSKRIPTGKKVLNSSTGDYEAEYMFVHDCCKKVICAEFETEKLK